jgi:hypothetical protein
MQLTEKQLKGIIKESVMNVLAEEYAAAQAQAPMQAAQQPQDQGFMDRAKRVKNLNVTLVNVWKESDALGLTDVKKWLGMAIASLDKEFASDTIGNAVQKGKEKIQGWFK